MSQFISFFLLLSAMSPTFAQRQPANPVTSQQQKVNQLLQEYVNAVSAVRQGRQVSADQSSMAGLAFIYHSGVYQRAGSDPCSFFDLVSGNEEIGTAEMRGGDIDQNLEIAAAEGYVYTSILQFECAQKTDPELPGRPIVGIARMFSRDRFDTTPGYSQMVRRKGKFAESIAPRRLTVMPGYGNDRSEAIQQMGTPEWKREFDNQVNKVQIPGMPPSPIDFDKLRDMSPPDIQRALAQIGEQRMLEYQQNIAQMASIDQQKVMQSIGMQSVEMLNSPAGRIYAASMKLLSPTKDGGTIGPLAFLDLLRPNESFVDAYKYRIRVGDGFGAEHYLLVVSQKDSRRYVDLGPAGPIDTAVNSFFRELKGGGDSAPFWKGMQELIVMPIIAALPGDTTNVWFSPDSSLGIVPIAALLLDMKSAVSVSVTPSAFDFVRLRSTPTPSSVTRALLVGNLDYGSSAGEFLKLGGTEKELRSLGDLAKAASLQVTQIEGEGATLPALTSPLADARYIHFATHGFVKKPTRPSASIAFSSAGIALSGANSEKPDAILSADQIRKLDLTNAKLITISACSSGQGMQVEGQGLLGFQTAFMAAGARSVLLSLWKVPDEATALLMKIFYENIWSSTPLSEVQALHKAQDSLRQDPRFANRINWAAWVLVGDGW